MGQVLVHFAHPNLERTLVERVLLNAAHSVPEVTVHDLNEEYPDFDGEVAREKEMLLVHQVIVLQHPFIWYSSPALMKQRIDLVLEHTWAYGRQGKPRTGKRMMNAISTGRNMQAYDQTGPNRHTIREFLAPFEQTAILCNMEYLPPFVFRGTHSATEADIEDAGDHTTFIGTLPGRAIWIYLCVSQGAECIRETPWSSAQRGRTDWGERDQGG